jgi:hypothetical protein
MPATRFSHILITSTALLAATGSALGAELKDPYLGEALYYAYQEHYFEALERLDAEIAQHYGVDEPHLDSLDYHIEHAEFSVGDFVAQHTHSYKELEALRKGGVQRIYTGNVPTGQHRLEVSVAGKLASGREFVGSESFDFDKDVEPKLVGITLATKATGDPHIELGGW